MKIEIGDKIKVEHSRKGIFEGVVLKDIEEWIEVELTEEYKEEYEVEKIYFRKTLAKITLLERGKIC